MEHLNDMMRLVGEELATFANSNVVVGTPIEFSTATVVPISRVSIGLGGGGLGGQGEGKVKSASTTMSNAEAAGGASTGAARVRPIAVVVFTDQSVDVLAIPEKIRKRDRIFDVLPDVVEKITNLVPSRKTEVEPKK